MIEEEVFYPSIKDQEHGRPQGQKPRFSFLPTQPRKHSEAAGGPVSACQAGPDLAVALTRQEGANGFRASPRERADSARQPLLRAGAPRSPAEPLLTGVSRPGAAPSTRKRTGTLGRRHGSLARSCRLCGVFGLRIVSPPPPQDRHLFVKLPQCLRRGGQYHRQRGSNRISPGTGGTRG